MYDNQPSPLIGKTVEYSVGKEDIKTGIILDKVLCKDSNNKNATLIPVTGFMVEDQSNKAVWTVPHWRITKIIS